MSPPLETKLVPQRIRKQLGKEEASSSDFKNWTVSGEGGIVTCTVSGTKG